MDEINLFLKKFIKGKKKQEGYFTAYLQIHWQKIVGHYIAEKSFPECIREDILFLNVVSPSWAHNFLMIKNEILEKIKSEINVIIKDIRFVVKKNIGSIEKKEEEEKIENIVLPKLDENEKINIKTLINEISDEKLSYKFSKLLEKDKIRKKYCLNKGFSICNSCGVQLSYNEKFCVVCNKKKKEKVIENLENMFYEIPWLSYEQAKEKVFVEKNLFLSVKAKCEQSFLAMALKENATNVEKQRYVMLKKNCNIFDLTEETIEKTMQESRRTKRVFTSRP